MKNVGGIDRMLRVTVGAGLIVYAISGGPAWAYVGAIPLLTGIFGFCPAYCPLKLSTAGGSCCTAKSCGEEKK